MRVFLHLKNSPSNKWFNFKTPSRSICTIITFLTCSTIGYLKPIMPEFYHVLGQRRTFGLQYDRFSQPFDYLPQFFPQHFIRDLDYSILQLQASSMCVHTSHWPYGYPPLHCHHGNKRTRTHDVICKTFATIARDVGFHVGWEQLHAFPLTTFNSSCRWINIVFTKDDICSQCCHCRPNTSRFTSSI
jgi:hypothetical protein